MIQIDRIPIERRYRYHFPTIDFKFQNTGTATAALWRFEVEVRDARVDPAPDLSFTAKVWDNSLWISGSNAGWGAAEDLVVRLEEPTLERVFDEEARTFRGRIASGGEEDLFRIGIDSARAAALEELSRPSVLKPPSLHNRVYRERDEGPREPPGVELETIRARWTCRDEHGGRHEDDDYVRVPWEGYIALNTEGFVAASKISRLGRPCAMPSDVTYVSLIDPRQGPHVRSYEISRMIPPGDVERFHIMIGAPMSCSFDLRFGFAVDQERTIHSEPFRVSIWNARNSSWEARYRDGEEINRDLRLERARAAFRPDGWWEDHGSDKLQRAADLFPFREGQ